MCRTDPRTSGAWRHGKKRLKVAWTFAKSGGYDNEKYDCELCEEAKYYEQRNCNKFFPDQPHNSKFEWQPEFQTSKGSFFGVSELQCTDCPVSFITPASRQLIQIECQNSILKDSTDGSLYYPNISHTPNH